jgi:hypothetical protein
VQIGLTAVRRIKISRRLTRTVDELHQASKIRAQRFSGISWQVYYRRYQEQGMDGLRDLSHHRPQCNQLDVIGQNYHFGPGEIAMYLKRYHDIEVKSTSNSLSQ